jgi:hypothetical protein
MKTRDSQLIELTIERKDTFCTGFGADTGTSGLYLLLVRFCQGLAPGFHGSPGSWPRGMLGTVNRPV